MSTPTPSTLDADQCIQGSYDDATGRLRVDAEITSSIIAPPGLEIAITDVDDAIKIGNGSGVYAQVTGANALKVDNSAVTQPISATSLPLPSGASTSALQTTANASLSSIDSKLTSPLAVTGTFFQSIQPVSQSGSWTNGRTWNLLNTTDSVNVGNFPAVQTVSVNNFPATQAVTQSGTWNINNLSGTISLPTGASTSANQATQITSLASIDSKLTSPLAVTGTFFQTTQPISAVSLPLPSNAAKETGGNLDTIVTNTTGIATAANQTTGNVSLSSIDSKLIDFNTTPVQTIQLFTKAYDSIAATYPSTTQEVYQSYVGGLSGTLQQTITINYTDTTKNFILNVVRT